MTRTRVRTMVWVVVGLILAALVVVPWYVHWLRHRPHRLTEGTQHIVFAGLAVQLLLLTAAVVVAFIWLRSFAR